MDTRTSQIVTPLHRLGERGQSVWLDQISRQVVRSGELQRLIVERSVTGLTSNPTIFARAIEAGVGYDEQLGELTAAGLTAPDELYIELTATDIQQAADVLRPVYDRTEGCDGFVSIEVPPSVGHDTGATIAIAQRLWHRVDRPNLMVKVPATPAGIPAIEQLITEGMNINITLIFALSAYEAVAEAYVRGLEARHRRAQSLAVRSVASFFVSRVDTAVDRLLDEKLVADPDNDEVRRLRGRAAIANARLAYETFERVFLGERFRLLREVGAAVQRPLWASTSAKNPAYRDVVYAEALIGPHTIDTMPEATLEAFADHGMVDGDTVRDDRAGAQDAMRRLAAVGIDMGQVTANLLGDGLRAFADSYNQALGVIAGRLERSR